MENFVTAERVREFLALKNVETVLRMVARDGLPAERVGVQYRFLLSEVRSWVREQSVAREAGAGQADVVPLHERRSA